MDGHPTIVVPGPVPAWRAIGPTTTKGVDVHQLESFLKSAGFTDNGAMTVDDVVTTATVAAIKQWQTALGVPVTGTVELGEVVFHDGDLTVVAINTKLGSVVTPGESVLDVRTGAPFVSVSTDSSWATIGSTVKISSGDVGTTGTISEFSAGIAKVTVAADVPLSDGASAIVTLTRTKVADQLLVPSSAILTGDVDGPTIAVKEGASTHVIRVEVVASANGTAAIKPTSGGVLAEGTQVQQF